MMLEDFGIEAVEVRHGFAIDGDECEHSGFAGDIDCANGVVTVAAIGLLCAFEILIVFKIMDRVG